MDPNRIANLDFQETIVDRGENVNHPNMNINQSTVTTSISHTITYMNLKPNCHLTTKTIISIQAMINSNIYLI